MRGYREKKHYYQRVLLSGTKVKCCLVQHLHKVLEAWNIDFIFHRLRMERVITMDFKLTKVN